MNLKKKLEILPAKCGVYLMKDKREKILYIGKAVSLKERVRSYFQSSRYFSPKIRAMVSQISDIEYILTDSEVEALILECNLIKKYRPYYNISLKDDKSYPYIEITLGEDFPSIFLTRTLKKDGSRYFGPYTNVKAVKQTLKLIHRLFPVRSCRKKLVKFDRPCLSYHLKECLGPCSGKVKKEDYLKVINEIILFLNGRGEQLVKTLRRKMEGFSHKLKFEEAARIKNQISALEKVMETKENASFSKEGFKGKNSVKELQNYLAFKTLPLLIEAFDVSNIKGKEAVGAVVVFKNGEPAKEKYRKFRIKSVVGIDDYKMIEEVIKRHYQKVLKEEGILPDLILVDGGKGQLSSALKVLKELDISEKVSVLGLAKKWEEIFLPQRSEPIILPPDSSALHLLQHIRDEAHRFAHRYHRVLRKKRVKESILDTIIGVGEKRKKALFLRFGSIEKIRKATREDLEKVPGVSKEIAKKISLIFLDKEKGNMLK